jgi:hypothetical protein
MVVVVVVVMVVMVVVIFLSSVREPVPLRQGIPDVWK